MDRTRNVFVTLVALTLLVGIGATIFSRLSGDDIVADLRPEASADQVGIMIASSNTKRVWLDQLSAEFNQSNHTTADGNQIVVTVQHVTSGGLMNAILDGSLQPTAWSPGDQCT